MKAVDLLGEGSNPNVPTRLEALGPGMTVFSRAKRSQRLWFDESAFAKLLTQSPIVEVDRTGGPRLYRYRLVDPPRPQLLDTGAS